jgi:predicted Zn-dependent protease
MRLIPVVIGLAAAGFVALKGCEDAPFGGKRVINVSIDQEMQLGAQAFQDVMEKEYNNLLPDDHKYSRVVQKVGQRLQIAAKNPVFIRAVAGNNKRLEEELFKLASEFKWRYKVVESDQLNAFCLPGGYIVFYTAILPVCKNEHGVATVMGHEIAHALARHGAQRMSQAKIAQIGQTAVATSLGNMHPAAQEKVLAAMGVGTNLTMLKFGRNHETEADHIGLFMMAAADYDPEESVAFWGRMQEATGGKSRGPEYLSTHPGPENRIAALKSWQEVARLIRDEAKRVTGPGFGK